MDSVSIFMDVDPPIPSGVSKLDARLLACILLLASANDEFCRNDAPTIRSKTARFTSQVNRRWREVALRQQELWLGPVLALSWCSASHWLDLVLKRSYPLPVDTIVPPEASSDSVTLTFKHLPRIRTLKLTARAHIEWLATESSHHYKPLILESLTISVPGVAPHTGRRSLRVCDPNPVFSGYAPMLHQLEVHNFPLNLAPKLFHGLRVLVFDIMHRSSVVQLLDNLRNMDQLEELHISQPSEIDTPPSSFPMHPPTDDPLFLQGLQALFISAPVSVCANVFRNITIRASCSITLRCRNVCNGRDLRDILSRLKCTISNWRCAELTGRQSLDIGGTYARFTLQGPAGGGQLCPSIDFEVSSPSLEKILDVFIQIAPGFQRCQTPPETLALYSAIDTPSEPRLMQVLHGWLSGLEYMQAVELHGHAAFGLYFPLLGSSETRSKYLSIRTSNVDDILLPDLGDLIMVSVNFTTQKRLFWRRLLKTLRFRDKLGQPILLMDFVNCVGDFDQNITGRTGVVVKVNGVDLNSDSEDDGEDSDYTAQGDSD
ncbi:hypothetical protein BDN70DRAFT_880581 [Pholiota conissans]|uniref:F-box domain-containing protein n=1 Tax=Pholiota conissans TaxID=109636 RepID=A0A9P6CT19_9AGAR|nr:hypothetical protein BDN70DRAFT_880581 [Pholiota conissans]